MRFSTPVCWFTFLMMAGCTAPPTIDVAAEREALMSMDRAWFEAYSTADNPVEAFLAGFVDDGTLLPPDMPIAQGKDAVRGVIAGLEAMPGFSVSWSPEASDVGSGGDLGFTRGSYEMMMEVPEGPITINGKYLTLWKKQMDGKWMVVADMFNANGPPTPQT